MGQPDKYFELFATHRTDLVRFARGIMRDDSLAEDVVQDAFLRLTTATVIQGRVLSDPLNYVYRIIRNLAFDRYRRRQFEAGLFDHGVDSSSETIEADVPTPEGEASGKSDMRAMRAAMAELPERTCVALEMHLFDGRKLREIAAHLGVSIGMAHSLVAAGMEHCRKRLSTPES
ncbi:RNA polymerase sigma factor [Acetobacter syzygii]|uniref:RNA polymerase sigma factor n=1 Tax=Acetobacter syzygii TaxID=146476 RepID=UPI00130E20DE|nr:sigma-70 family RNA polymerase sigma factor [Acetobacter syzygii]